MQEMKGTSCQKRILKPVATAVHNEIQQSSMIIPTPDQSDKNPSADCPFSLHSHPGCYALPPCTGTAIWQMYSCT